MFASPASSPCQLDGLPTQTWNASHQAYDNGRNDGFVKASGPIAMRFWDKHDLPFTYSLVKHFPIGERYFCSVLAQTYPNRRFLFAGTSSGSVDDGRTRSRTGGQRHDLGPARQHRVDWGNYYQNVPSLAHRAGLDTPARPARA